MLKSLKTKFTVFYTVSATLVVIIFALLVFIINIVNARNTLSEQDLLKIGSRNPVIQRYLKESGSLEKLRLLGDTVRDEQRERFIGTMLIVIPPSIFISALVAYIVSSYLVRPIEEVAYYTAQIGVNNLSKRIPENTVSSSEEIEALISNFNRLLEDLEISFNAQEQFIQDAAHELRTPLAAIKTNIEVAKEQDLSIQDYEKLLLVINSLNQRLIYLSENLLFLSRNQKARLKTTKINMHELIEDVIETFEAKFTKEQITLKVDLFAGDAKLKVDPEKITLALQNLISNAIKYSKASKGKDSPQIKVRTLLEEKERTKKKYFVIIVKDNGIGIPAAEKDKIFKRFFRASNAMKHNSKGEGLGLAIVDKIIKDHNGFIELESKLNKGSELKVFLPVS